MSYEITGRYYTGDLFGDEYGNVDIGYVRDDREYTFTLNNLPGQCSVAVVNNFNSVDSEVWSDVAIDYGYTEVWVSDNERMPDLDGDSDWELLRTLVNQRTDNDIYIYAKQL